MTRLSDDLAERIRRLIISEDIAEGSRLPPERDLAERFGASRPTVSQALRALSLMGLVEIRRGSGAYVVRRPETMVTASVNLMLDLNQRSLSDLMQLRLWLETLGAREAATRAPDRTSAEDAAISATLGRLGDSARQASEVISADTVFHATVRQPLPGRDLRERPHRGPVVRVPALGGHRIRAGLAARHQPGAASGAA